MGSGLPYFSGTVYQRGNGLGSLFGSLIRGISPLIRRMPTWIKTGAKMAGKQAMKSGVDILRDVASGENLSFAGKKRAREAGADFLEAASKRLRQSGEGLRRRAVRKQKSVSIKSGVKVNRGASKKKKKQVVVVRRSKQDIFQ